MPVFISYSFQDEAIFSLLCLVIDQVEIKRWDSKTMSLGESLSDQLKQAIDSCEVCVFIATRRSIESPWCLAELGAFWGVGKRVLLFMADPDLSETTLPPQFKGTLRAHNGLELLEELKRTMEDFQLTHVNKLQNEFFRSCGEYGREGDWLNCLDRVSQNFDSVGVTLSAWRRIPQFRDKVLSKASNGCKIRLLFLAEHNSLLGGLLYKGRELEDVISLIRESRSFYLSLDVSHDNIEVRQIYEYIPHFSLARMDDDIIITQYVSAETWGAGPTWKCTAPSPLFEASMNEFEHLWKTSEKVTS